MSTHHHGPRCYHFPTNASVCLTREEAVDRAKRWRAELPGFSVRIAERGVRAYHQGATVWVVVARRLICGLAHDLLPVPFTGGGDTV